MDSVNELLSAMDGGQIVECLSLLSDSTIESILVNRDADEFSSKWIESFNAIEMQKASINSHFIDLVTKIRESSYLKAYGRWKSPDLAAYISDDFGLIGDALALKIQDPWVGRLLQSYLDGVIPS